MTLPHMGALELKLIDIGFVYSKPFENCYRIRSQSGIVVLYDPEIDNVVMYYERLKNEN